MDFLTGLWGFVAGTLAPFLFVLMVVVFIHEMGHFLVGRWNGVRVEAFSIGFGPEVFGYNDSRGTRWRLALIPLGGYVRFLGDVGASSREDEAALARMTPEQRTEAFPAKALWRRAAIVVAGPVANFILAIAIYTGLFATYDDVSYRPVVASVVDDSAAQAAGVQPGDRFVTIDGDPVATFFDVQRRTMQSSDTALAVTVDRAGELIDLTITPRMTERTDEFGNTYKTGLLGVVASNDEAARIVRKLGVGEAFAKAVDRTVFVVTSTFNFLRELILGKQDASELRGPIGIGEITSDVATLGFTSLLGLMAVLSISIGLLNLFPIPMLDGGHLMFYAIEAVRGRKLSERATDIAYRIGVACVLGLMIFATSNDVVRVYSRIFG